MTSPSWASKLKALPRLHLKGRFFRMVRAEDAEEILSTGPSFAYGGRYNKRGEFGALYLSDDARTCEQEKLKQVSGQRELLPAQMIGSIEIDIKGVVDLSDQANLKKLGIGLKDLTDEVNRVVPQDIGDLARKIDVPALLVQSVAALGKNLVIFEEALTRSDCRLRVLNIEKWIF